MPGFAFPTVGPLGLSSPPSQSVLNSPDHRYYAPLRLPSAHLGSLRFSLSFPDTLTCFHFLCVPFPAHRSVGSHPAIPRLLFSQYPLSSGIPGGRQKALPSSRVVPVNTCPALRPRWCPENSPFRLQDCCLPLFRQRRLSQAFI
jgi:hypothetical protein